MWSFGLVGSRDAMEVLAFDRMHQVRKEKSARRKNRSGLLPELLPCCLVHMRPRITNGTSLKITAPHKLARLTAATSGVCKRPEHPQVIAFAFRSPPSAFEGAGSSAPR
jgi:hypothetical protein